MSHPDYEEFLASFNARRVRYLIGGAHALALYARPRASKDLDLFIDSTVANTKRAETAIAEFFGGDAPRYAGAVHLRDPNVIVQLGVAPVRIGLLSELRGAPSFRAAWKRRVEASFGKVDANYLSLEDLIAEKEHWARPQDLADLKQLRRALARAQVGAGRQPKGRR